MGIFSKGPFGRRWGALTCGVCAVFFFLAAQAPADEKEWFVPLGQPPQTPPKRISGGESFPPLPLPATPLRRTERKRQPSPPKLIGKVMWGEKANFAYENGMACEIADWNLCPTDVKKILEKAGNALGMRYGEEPVLLGTFHGDPRQMPVLFLSGTRTLKLDQTSVAALRTFVLQGGMVIFDSIAGSPYFYDSARNVIEQVIPGGAIRTIPADHPLYHIVYDVDKVGYPRNVNTDKPFLEGVYVGCRVAILLSKYGLGCGWDDHEVPLIPKAAFYNVDSACKLGVNIIAYAVGYADVGGLEARPELSAEVDEKAPTSELVFAQLEHGGAWNVHPGAASALLRNLRQNSSVKVNLKRQSVKLGRDDLAPYAFLYMTGLDDFTLDERAVDALRRFLSSSGTLLINNGLGMKTFDAAVRRELKKVLPEAELAPVPSDHPLYSSAFAIVEAGYTSTVRLKSPNLKTPTLEGISLNGDLKVIYSPYDVESGWMGSEPPMSLGYDASTATRLGVNIVVYAVTH